ncbi:hypothetical protein IAQ61_010314 [Plenodomus lingam]|uniref:uncharacterized protein n=1 Tax=Leptosphaeria maculans TaxID=5022 RepID=UPI00331BAFCD|nr:hypothetical protein IAQ61_010314 [Plenodomus lingam]
MLIRLPESGVWMGASRDLSRQGPESDVPNPEFDIHLLTHFEKSNLASISRDHNTMSPKVALLILARRGLGVVAIMAKP